jgi:hypothetical protein
MIVKSGLLRRAELMKWEYKTIRLSTKAFFSVKFDDTQFENYMNGLGQQEWELVAALTINQCTDTKEVVAVFKRPKQ